jgi:hypothetical protein
MIHTVTITFSTEASSPEYAKMIVTSFLRGKGVVIREEANGLEGYDQVEVLAVNN